ncbi:Uncharacterised protein [Bordetella pertussis]|nr:Uncharacterised protein [Bordetella pertussis]
MDKGLGQSEAAPPSACPRHATPRRWKISCLPRLRNSVVRICTLSPRVAISL